jgi:hypothetical protein
MRLARQLSGGKSIEFLWHGRGAKSDARELAVRRFDLERLDESDICLLDSQSAGLIDVK